MMERDQGTGGEPVRLVTIRIEEQEEAAIVLPGGLLPVREINGFRGDGGRSALAAGEWAFLRAGELVR